MNILITSAGQRVSLVRAFKAELLRMFPEGRVLTTDMMPELSAACNVSDGYFKVSRVTDPNYISQLIDICLNNQISMVVPTIDTELLTLANNKKTFNEHNIHCIISSAGFVEKCRDKRKIHLFFAQHGIRVPQSVDKVKPTFPLFIKPFDGSLSVDTQVAHSPEDLRAQHVNSDRFMFMEYLSKDEHDEYTVDMYYDKTNTVKCIVPRKRLWIRAGEINKGITVKNGIVDFLKEKLARIEGAIGCQTLQVFLNRSTGIITAIEINPRFGGGFPLSYRAGANYPGWLIQEYFLNQDIEYTQSWEDQLLMLRYDDEVIVHANKN